MAEKEKKKREKKSSLWLFGCLVMIVFGCATGLVSLALGIGNLSFDIFLSYFKLPVLLLFNVLPSVLLHLALYMLFGRPWLAFFVGSGAVLGAGVLQGFKIWLQRDVFYFSDLLPGGSRLGFLPDLSGVSLNWVMIGALIYFVFGIVFLIVLFRRRRAPWLAGRLVGMLVFLCLFYPYYREASNVEKYAELTDNSAVVADGSELMKYVSKGFLYPFVLTAENSGEKKAPGGYQQSRAAQMLSEYEASAIPEDKKADVIALQLSGFTDLAAMGAQGIDGKEVYELYDKLKEASFSGRLYAADYTESGLVCAESFLAGSVDPGLVRRNTNSYVWYMSAQGLRTWGVSAKALTEGSRNRVYGCLGFEDFVFAKDGEAEGIKGGSDWWLFGELQKQYKTRSAEASGAQFVFAESAPHADIPEDVILADYTDGSLEPKVRDKVNAYLNSVVNTLYYLNNLTEQLEASARPVVLLVYGDGSPDLGADVYSALGIETELDTPQAMAARCGSEYVIWMNSAAKAVFVELTGRGPEISVNYLMAELFSRLGWGGPSFMAASRGLYETLPVVTAKGLYMLDGAFTDKSQLPLEVQSLLYNYEYMEYYWEDHFGLVK